MLFKLLCTLCTLVSSSSSLAPHAIPSPMTTNDSVLITVDMDGTLIHDLCDDFTNTTCAETLFEASEKLDFMTIDSQTILLKPNAKDGACYGKAIPICFEKTYPLTISAVNANDHKLITDKRFTITVQSSGKEEIEVGIVVFVLLGSGVACALSSCARSLLLRLRAEAAQMRH